MAPASVASPTTSSGGTLSDDTATEIIKPSEDEGTAETPCSDGSEHMNIMFVAILIYSVAVH